MVNTIWFRFDLKIFLRAQAKAQAPCLGGTWWRPWGGDRPSRPWGGSPWWWPLATTSSSSSWSCREERASVKRRRLSQTMPLGALPCGKHRRVSVFFDVFPFSLTFFRFLYISVFFIILFSLYFCFLYISVFFIFLFSLYFYFLYNQAGFRSTFVQRKWIHIYPLIRSHGQWGRVSVI